MIYLRNPPPSPGADSTAGDTVDPAAELLGVAGRIYATNEVDVRAALADSVIACAVALGGTAFHAEVAAISSRGTWDTIACMPSKWIEVRTGRAGQP